jgi:hypothetical protein
MLTAGVNSTLKVKVGLAVGRCPICKRVYVADRPAFPLLCDCHKICPICGAEMQAYQPDLTPQTYTKDGKHDLNIFYVCYNHSPPYYSTRKPVEVVPV